MASLTVTGRGLKALLRPTASARKQLSSLATLDYEFEGMPKLSPQPTKATEASVSTLPSGLVVVTESTCATSTVSMTFPKAGSGEEMLDEQGASFMNKCMAFKSGSDMSTRFLYRSVEFAGATPFVTGDRHGVTLGYTGPRDTATKAINTLAVDCSFEPWDVKDSKVLAAIETEEAGASAQIVLTENLYAAAYGPQSPAGRGYYFSTVPLDLLQSFRERAYGLNGAVLTATGVANHGDFCAEVTEALKAAPAGNPDKPTPFTYLGGESRVSAPTSGYTHVALAFANSSSSVMGSIIKHALTLAGMPAGVQGFATKGLVGVYAGAAGSSGLVDTMTATLTGTLSADIIKRAKTLAKFEALMAVDGGSKTLAEAMTASILETGTFSDPAAIAKAYDSVSDMDVTTAMASALKSNPSLAAVGEISMVPYQATIAARFG